MGEKHSNFFLVHSLCLHCPAVYYYQCWYSWRGRRRWRWSVEGVWLGLPTGSSSISPMEGLSALDLPLTSQERSVFSDRDFSRCHRVCGQMPPDQSFAPSGIPLSLAFCLCSPLNSEMSSFQRVLCTRDTWARKLSCLWEYSGWPLIRGGAPVYIWSH